jgi:hypothetical protein
MDWSPDARECRESVLFLFAGCQRETAIGTTGAHLSPVKECREMAAKTTKAATKKAAPKKSPKAKAAKKAKSPKAKAGAKK